jgi:hypothetical protein
MESVMSQQEGQCQITGCEGQSEGEILCDTRSPETTVFGVIEMCFAHHQAILSVLGEQQQRQAASRPTRVTKID